MTKTKKKEMSPVIVRLVINVLEEISYKKKLLFSYRSLFRVALKNCYHITQVYNLSLRSELLAAMKKLNLKQCVPRWAWMHKTALML